MTELLKAETPWQRELQRNAIEACKAKMCLGCMTNVPMVDHRLHSKVGKPLSSFTCKALVFNDLLATLEPKDDNLAVLKRNVKRYRTLVDDAKPQATADLNSE